MAKVVMYSTAVCPYCQRAEMLLKSKGVTEIEKIRIDLDPAQRDLMMQKTGRRTVPRFLLAIVMWVVLMILPPWIAMAASCLCCRPKPHPPLN